MKPLHQTGARKKGFFITDAAGNATVLPFGSESDVMTGDGPTSASGVWGLVVADGTSSPPEFVYNEAGTDFLYADGPEGS